MDMREGEWQYKVVSGIFSTRDAVESLIEEQAAWGWQLVEVLNYYQIRMGRPAHQALKDVAREGNPYATRSSRSGLSRPLIAIGFMVLMVIGLASSLIFIKRVSSVKMATPVVAPPVDSPFRHAEAKGGMTTIRVAPHDVKVHDTP